MFLLPKNHSSMWKFWGRKVESLSWKLSDGVWHEQKQNHSVEMNLEKTRLIGAPKVKSSCCITGCIKYSQHCEELWNFQDIDLLMQKSNLTLWVLAPHLPLSFPTSPSNALWSTLLVILFFWDSCGCSAQAVERHRPTKTSVHSKTAWRKPVEGKGSPSTATPKGESVPAQT